MRRLDSACQSQVMQRSRFGTPWLGRVLALSLVTLAVTACEEERPRTDTGIEYAAIGDSFAAAPDLPTVTTDGCHRSDHNFAHLVAKQLEDVKFRDVSCGGARTDAVLQSQVIETEGRVRPPQIEAVSATTDIVTVGLGVNDFDFAVTAAFGCLLLAGSDPNGSPCRDSNAKKVPRVLEKIHERYVDTIGAIASRAPDAQIIAVGYPRLLAEGSRCPDVFPLAKGDFEFVQESYDQLNQTVEAAAEEAGVEYVDVARASEGHDICSDDPWINGDRADKKTGAAAYHPMPAEQAAVAELILDLL
jgi:hypothetical protein